MQDRIIEWCPDVKGACVRSPCAAYSDKVVYKIDDASFFINKFVPGSVKGILPLSFGLEVHFCRKYELFIDQESKNMFEMFTAEIVQEENKCLT